MEKNPDPPQPKQPHVIEWEKTVKYAADHGYHAMHTALVEDGPDPEINYSALREESPPQPQAGQQPEINEICANCGETWGHHYGDRCSRAPHAAHFQTSYFRAVEATQPQPEPQFKAVMRVANQPGLSWWKCRLCGACTAGKTAPTDHVCSNPNQCNSGERVEGEMTAERFWPIWHDANEKDNVRTYMGEKFGWRTVAWRFAEAYAAHQLAGREAEIAQLRRQPHVGLMLRCQDAESREQRLREALQQARIGWGRMCVPNSQGQLHRPNTHDTSTFMDWLTEFLEALSPSPEKEEV